MNKITVYEKPTCTTCRKTTKLLDEKGVDFEKVKLLYKTIHKEQTKKTS